MLHITVNFVQEKSSPFQKKIALKLPRIYASVLSVFNVSNTEAHMGHRRTCTVEIVCKMI